MGVLLQARLCGDVARVELPPVATTSNERQRGGQMRGEEQEEKPVKNQQDDKVLGQILSRSFGKIVEVGVYCSSQQSPTPRRQQIATATRSLQLSLEEAFYLHYEDACLELSVEDAPATTPLVADVPKGLPAESPPHPPLPAQRGQDIAGNRREGHETHIDNFPHDDGATGGFRRRVDVTTRLNSETAWQYCCGRRPAFPATFAVYRHFRSKGYTVHAGQKYGAHFVLYEGSPDECHSRYCVHVTAAGGGDSWGHMKTMTRLMPDIAKCLLVCGVSYNNLQAATAATAAAAAATSSFSSFPSFTSSSPLDTDSLGALAGAKVTTLSFSRSSDAERSGNSVTTAAAAGEDSGGGEKTSSGKKNPTMVGAARSKQKRQQKKKPRGGENSEY